MVLEPEDLTPKEWEQKAELALQAGNMGDAVKFAHYANVSDLGYDPLKEGGYREGDENYTPADD